MTQKWMVGMILGAMMTVAQTPGSAAEHGGQEHGGQTQATAAPSAPTKPSQPAQPSAGQTAQEEAAVTPQAEPAPEQIRQAIRDYIGDIEREDGAFTIDDEVTSTTRTLTLERVHERVGKTGDYYYSCTDMRDTSSRELLDLDFDVEHDNGLLTVVDVRIHKLNGKPRYTYDDKDNRIPL